MNSLLYGITSNVIENYKLVKNNLRFDGEYINHFASLIFAEDDEHIDIEKIKEIRRYIKLNTNKMSSFRGDILYMISILISKEKDYINFADKLIETNEILKDNGFKDSAFLVLSSYALIKHVKKSQMDNILNDMKIIYKSLKFEYNDLTDEEDYLICALLAIKNSKTKTEIRDINKFIKSMFDYLSDLDNYSKNDLQGVASTLLLNNSASAPYEIKELIKNFNKNDMKIGDEVLPLIGAVAREENIFKYIKKVKEVIKCLCDEEGEYTFYMDKTFRTLIAIVTVEIYERNNSSFKNEYLEELLCFAIYSFIVSKKQGLFEEVLA